MMRFLSVALSMGACSASATEGLDATVAPPLGFKPNIIFFLADDFGRYNSGWAGNKEARTPNIDALVQQGIIMDYQYTFKYCSPTRSSFLSGRLPYHVNQANRPYSAVGGVDIRMTMLPEHLKTAGYGTHQIGKWHAGSSCEANMPVNRGFDTSYGYLGGSEGHYNQREGNGKNSVDGTTVQPSNPTSPVDLWVNEGPGYGLNGTYNAFAYTAHHVAIIEAAAVAAPVSPFFVYHAWQEAHVPNEVPVEYEDPSIDFLLRRVYEGMVHCMDSGIGNITAALKKTGAYEKTLIVFSADNGGREDSFFGGNNYPLRGMKFTDFEGGTRVASWVSGGVVPASQKGTTHSKGLVHVADWYATFCHLAGVDPTDKKAAAHQGIPAIDSINHWDAIAKGIPTTRNSIVLAMPVSGNPDAPLDDDGHVIETPLQCAAALTNACGAAAETSATACVSCMESAWPAVAKTLAGSSGCSEQDKAAFCGTNGGGNGGDWALILWPHKLVMGTQGGKGWWTSPIHPNSTSAHAHIVDPGCPSGCVFDLTNDPGEHHDLSASLPQVKKQLIAAADEAKKTAFQTNETPGYTNCENASVVQKRNHGFVGIVCTKDEL